MKARLSPEERRERRHRALRRSKFALPSAITLTSVLCGFSSVVLALDAPARTETGTYFLASAVLLLLAAVLDMFDGMVARATNTQTEFGVQLDSLADVLSFGMAPAILAYKYGFFLLGQADPRLRALGWGASFFFLACSALRLARFNVQVGESDPRFFVGMPTPAGAAAVASVILCFPHGPSLPWQARLLAAELFLVGLLMVSPLRFPSVKKLSSRGSSRIWLLAAFAGILSLLVIFPRTFPLTFLVGYTTAAILLNLAWAGGWRGVIPPTAHPKPVDQ